MYSEYQYSESGGTYGTVQQVTYIYQAPASSSISGSSVYGTSSSVSGAGNNTTTYQQGVQRTSTKPISLPPTRLQDSTKAETLEFIKLDHHLEQDMSHHIRSVSPLLQTSIKLDQQLVQEFTKPNLEVTQHQVQAVTNLTKEDHPTTTNQLLVTDLVVEVEPVNHHQLNTLAVQHTNSKRND